MSQTHTATMHPAEHVHFEDATAYMVPVGRLLFAAIFVLSSLNHFSQATIDYAAREGVPIANVLVPLSGVMALVGGISIVLGYHARVGALLLILFLVPVTLMMHNFLNISDPEVAAIQKVMFMKNMSMLGGAILLAYFGSGPISMDQRTHPTLTD